MRRLNVMPCVTAVLIMFAQLGCGDDEPSDKRSSPNTCTTGRNMTDPRLVDGLEPAPGGATIRITWDPGTDLGAQLPSDYFAAAQVSSDTPEEVQNLVSSISLTEERQLTVRFRNMGPYLSTHRTLDFALAFPDRRNFSACTHSGMDDTYLLRVSLAFDEREQFQGATFTEDISLGDI